MQERILNRIQWTRLFLYVGLAALLLQFAYLIAIRPFIRFQILELIIVVVLVPIGFVIGRSLYFQRAHLAVRYNDSGFQIVRGGKQVENHTWDEFVLTSIFTDSYGDLNVRLYFERDGLYLDIPVSRAGGDPFELRSFVQNRLRR